MQGKIFGIPLILILLVAFIAGLVDLPMYYMTRSVTEKVQTALVLMNESNQRVVNCSTPVVVPTPVPVPSVSVTKGVSKLSTPSAVRK